MKKFENEKNYYKANCFEQKNITGLARCLLRSGFSVIPLRVNDGGLKPCLQAWRDFQDNQINPAFVDDFFSNAHGVAIVTGKVSDCIALDVDDTELFNSFYPVDLLKRQAGLVVKTKTDGCFHAYFKYDEQFDKYMNFLKQAGFEVKSNKTLCTFYSTLPEFPYRVEKCDQLTAIPEELADKIESLRDKKPQTQGLSNVEGILQKVYELTGYIPQQRAEGIWRAKCLCHSDKHPSMDIKLVNGKIRFKCWAGCSEQEIKQILGLNFEPQKQDKTSKDKLIELFEGFEFFHDAFENCYCKTPEGIVWSVPSHKLKGYIYSKFMKRYGKIPYSQAVSDLIQLLKGLAFEGKQKRVFTRVACDEDLIEIFLKQGLSLQITPTEIKIDKPQNIFMTSSGFLPLPEPVVNSEIDYRILTEFMNISAEQALIITLWILGSFNDVEKPLLLVLGEKEGVGKSFSTSLTKRLIDPSVPDLTSFPYSEEDLIVSAFNSFVLAYDNVSRLSKEAQDWLCRLCTGGGLKRRKRFTDDETAVVNVLAPVIINGINNPVTQVDLRRRTLTITLKALKSFKTKEACLKNFNKIHPYLLFYVSVLLQKILKNKEVYETDVDLADFVCFTSRAGLVKSVPELIKQNRKQLVEETIEDNLIVNAIKKILDGKNFVVTYAKEIILEIEKERPNLKYTPKKIHSELKYLLSDLETLGIKVKTQRTESGYEIHLERKQNKVQNVQEVQDGLKINELGAEHRLNIDLNVQECSGQSSGKESKDYQDFTEGAEHPEHQKSIFLKKELSKPITQEDEDLEEFTW